MAAEFFVTWNEAAFTELLRHESLRSAVREAGETIAARARAAAPRSAVHHGSAPGHGADTIHAELVLDDGEWVARVGWDQLHAYMRFPNRRSRFLERAADPYTHI